MTHLKLAERPFLVIPNQLEKLGKKNWITRKHQMPHVVCYKQAKDSCIASSDTARNYAQILGTLHRLQKLIKTKKKLSFIHLYTTS